MDVDWTLFCITAGEESSRRDSKTQTTSLSPRPSVGLVSRELKFVSIPRRSTCVCLSCKDPPSDDTRWLGDLRVSLERKKALSPPTTGRTTRLEDPRSFDHSYSRRPVSVLGTTSSTPDNETKSNSLRQVWETTSDPKTFGNLYGEKTNRNLWTR